MDLKNLKNTNGCKMNHGKKQRKVLNYFFKIFLYTKILIINNYIKLYL